jgi:hypothetical protein
MSCFGGVAPDESDFYNPFTDTGPLWQPDERSVVSPWETAPWENPGGAVPDQRDFELPGMEDPGFSLPAFGGGGGGASLMEDLLSWNAPPSPMMGGVVFDDMF